MTTLKFNLKKYQEIIDNLAAVGCKPNSIIFYRWTEVFTGELVKGKIPTDFVHTSITNDAFENQFGYFPEGEGVEIVGGDFYGNENDKNQLWGEDGIRG